MLKIGIGYENYKRIIDDGCYFVDKTLLIKDVIGKGGMVTLFTRPRRFGKTLALSMLRTFFELEYDRNGNVIEKKHYFEGKKIVKCEEEILSKMGQYPVIMLSLKSAKKQDFNNSFLALRDNIIDEFDRHSYLMDSTILSSEDIEIFTRFYRGKTLWNKKRMGITDKAEYQDALTEECGVFSNSLKILSRLLEKHHGKKTIILIDEYDVPLETAYYNGFYEEMSDFIRSLFEAALKTNDALERAVVTGCLRISKESIFTGLNNFTVNSVRSTEFGEYFGFTPEENLEMLDYYGLREKNDIVRKWYDGYLFGENEVYNPWSVTHYIYDHINAPDRLAEPYWSNTSSNSIIKDMVNNADETAKEELDLLINGGTVEKRIHDDITYNDIHAEPDNLWNFLFFTGYLRKVSEKSSGRDIYMTMRIPNEEVASIYDHQIRLWFEDVVKQTDQSAFRQAVLDRDTQTMENYLTDLMEKSISTFDCSESFYHGLLLSLLHGIPRYTTRSNREAGDGRPDIILYPERPKDPAMIFELKVRKKFNEMESGLKEALAQIKEKKYAEGILEDGYIGAVSFGVCFCKKSCIVGLLG